VVYENHGQISDATMCSRLNYFGTTVGAPYVSSGRNLVPRQVMTVHIKIMKRDTFQKMLAKLLLILHSDCENM